MSNLPQTRLELLRSIEKRLTEAKTAGCEFLILEIWEASWLLIPTLMALESEEEGTGEIVPLIPNHANDDLTKRNTPIQITTVENYLRTLDCEAATQETRAN